MEIRLRLILAVCIVSLRLADVQPHDQIADQVITDEMKDNADVRENFQNFFDSISKHDKKKNEIFNEILKQDVMDKRHAFDRMKGKLQIARNEDFRRRRNSNDRNFVPVERGARVKYDLELGGGGLKPSIYDFSEAELTEWMAEHGKSSPISDRIWRALYRQRVNNFNEIKELSSSTRSLLDRELSLPHPLEEDEIQYAKDGTIKCLLKLIDGYRIETVLMDQKYGLTICITTQVGCNIGCTFCASGLLRKKRDLTAGEMVQQVLHMQKILDAKPDQKKIRNVVLMGIGEPFDNYDHVMRFLRIVNNARGFGVGDRHITVSTSGLARQIKEFAHEDVHANLAISLHAANNALRTRLMKLNKAIPIEKLMEATDYYLNKTKRKIALEYILLKDINDSESCAVELANLVLARSQPDQIYVNLIPYNPVNELDNYQRSPPETVVRFYRTLNGLGVRAITRAEYGTDIDAACGQLRSKQQQNNDRSRT